NSRYVNADPEEGCAIAVAEAARNIVCSWGEPVAITNCLNFGNPYVPEVYWQFVGAIKGMKKACEKFDTPVTGGNVSFYNQSSDEGPVFPTPTIGMLGLMDDPDNRMTLNFNEPGDLIYLVGASKNDLASSEYLYSYRGVKASPAPAFNLDEEYAVQQAISQLIADKQIVSAHDVSDGGLFVTLAESAMAGNVGFAVTTDATLRMDAFLFGESQSRVVVSIKPENRAAFETAVAQTGVPFRQLGTVSDGPFTIDGDTLLTVAEAKDLYDNALGKIMQ
ncbi:MAG: phosphoribosylformylglycinamidine synthase subunit PurL, partial [Bacteroidetes bacterium]|nr:phosphoribosylformylglycinamidine synthase subunit PurL [Fibrella sp.]